jgi:hypothetical protein
MVANVYSPSIQESEWGGLLESQSSLPAWATQQDPISNKQNKTHTHTHKKESQIFNNVEIFTEKV